MQGKERADSQDSEVSFDDSLHNTHLPASKVPHQICSENVLGKGARKFSSAKMKALVANPFERHIRQQEGKREDREKMTEPEGQKFL